LPLFALLFRFFIGWSNKKNKVFQIPLPNNTDGRLFILNTEKACFMEET